MSYFMAGLLAVGKPPSLLDWQQNLVGIVLFSGGSIRI